MTRSISLPALPLLLVSAVLFFFMGWLFSLPINAELKDLVIERGYMDRSHGDLTIDELSNKEFKPFSGPLFSGNNSEPLWLRIKVDSSSQRAWMIVVQPAHIHHADLYWVDERGQWIHKRVGSKHRFSDRDAGLLIPAVHFTPQATAPTWVYIRAVTPTAPFYVRVAPVGDVMALDENVQIASSLFSGVGILMVVISLMVFIATRDYIWLFDSIYNLTGLFYLFIALGFASKFIWPEESNVVNQLMTLHSVLHTAVGSMLFHRIFSLFSLPRWLLWYFLLIPIALPMLIWMALAGYADESLIAINFFILSSSFLGLCASFVAGHKDKFFLYALRASYVLSFGFILWWIGPVVLKIQTESYSALYPNVPLGMLSMFMMMLILVRHTQLKIQDSLNIEIEKRQVEFELQIAKQRHEDSNSFYGMLMHEVKTPLSTIRMAVSNLEKTLANHDESVLRRLKRVQAAVDNVDNVLKRGVDVDILEQGVLVPEFASVNISTLIHEVCMSHPDFDRFKYQIQEDVVVRVDQHLLVLMVNNLIDNAAKYSPPNSNIAVYLQIASDTDWRLEVSNQAGNEGFPDPSRVFQKYYRAERAVAKSGIGLGLYWVRGVARRMGGDAFYERQDQHVVFGICLPI